MGEGIGKITEIILQFCRENLNIIMISGAALVLLIIIIAVVLSARKDDDDDDLNFDEPAFIKEQNKNHGDEPAEEKQSYTKRTVSREGIESLLEEIAQLPPQTLKEVEIKIQGAEVKIKYACDEDKPCDEPVKTFIFKEDSKPTETKSTKDTLYNLSIEDITKEIKKAQAEDSESGENEYNKQVAASDKPSDKHYDSQNSYAEVLNEEGSGEQFEEGSAKDKAIRKFGPDNINTTRSGKLFTEEELKEKIRD